MAQDDLTAECALSYLLHHHRHHPLLSEISRTLYSVNDLERMY